MSGAPQSCICHRLIPAVSRSRREPGILRRTVELEVRDGKFVVNVEALRVHLQLAVLPLCSLKD
jgi:hypothetical protein